MKTIGLIGGMSWESTIPYYSIINEYMKNHLGGLHSAKLVLYNVDFAELERCLPTGDWDTITKILVKAAKSLENAGVNFILICTNTMHNVFEQVQDSISIPLIHIADATADAIKDSGYKKVALLGTKYTMTEKFYVSRLSKKGYEVLIPNEEDIELVNSIIFDELCLGIINNSSRKEYIRIIQGLKDKGAQAVIFGCTEIGLLLSETDSPLPVYDTTVIHATKAAIGALKD